ncbi:DUF4214 domain-containing protein [Pseudomonas sp. 21LCFQ010]|uniref:DUF4214 domain-containing protein n=1 Tax=Pseudomonas sp. 21LCFQ010 TaxID=2957506 RepID=UPI0020970C08|nr:DUF4214 domain-containing protein [Pseudomonas sp. 21LCFQ010]MCO8164199.1 DUF4214 domain-containing protein [Pseudomonas sp. 21LCFQ010]
MAASAYFNQVQQLYIAYFGRPADPTGLNFWAANIDAAGGNLNGVIAGFSASSESKALYASATTAQLVSSIYVALFNRNPEPAGLAYWVQQIDSGTVSGPRAAYEILSSAGPGDASAIANKVSAATAFTSQIDTQAEISGYSGSTAANYGRAFLSGVDATPVSLNNATASSSLATTVATATGTNVVVTPPATSTGQTFTLTASADTVTGTAGNDTITSTVVGGFGTGDKIDGGAGTDTLSVTTTGALNSTGVTVTNVETASFTTTGNLTLNTTTWTGLNTLTTQVTDGITKATAGNTALVLTSTASKAGSMGDIQVSGGSTVTINQVANNPVNTTVTMGSVTVSGTVDTTKVTVNNASSVTADAFTAGVFNTSVEIHDVNKGSASTAVGKITNVSAKGIASAVIYSNALSDLSITDASAQLAILNNSSLAIGNKVQTLNLTVNNANFANVSDENIYTTLNVITSGKGSTFGNIKDSALTTLNVSGSQTLTLTSTTGMTALSTVKVSGSAGLTADLSSATVTSINASGTSGNITVTFDANKASYIGGSGNDTLTIGVLNQDASINVGSGNDQLKLNGVQTTKLGFASVTGMSVGTGDKIDFSAAKAGGVANSIQTTLGAKLATQVSLDAYLDAATAGDGSTTAILSWFQFGGDTYVVQDTSTNGTFDVGKDSVVKLSGTLELAASTIANGVLSL